MSKLTDYAENKITDALLRQQALGAPATWYVGLFTSDPGDLGDQSGEETGTGYARASFAASLANWSGTQGAGTTVASSGTAGLSSNNVNISFPTPGGDWSALGYWGLLDASSGGNMWVYGPLDEVIQPLDGDKAPYFPSTNLQITIG